MKKIIILVILGAFLFTGLVPSAKVYAQSVSSFYSYETHPNFWKTGTHDYVAKQYTRLPMSPTPGYDLVWVWSGPYNANQRYVIHQAYRNGQPSEYREWELWRSDLLNHGAWVDAYGGIDAQAVSYIYPTFTSCVNRNSLGVGWPSVISPQTLAYTPQSLLNQSSGDCSTSWDLANQAGGYIAVDVSETWGEPFSQTRNLRCDEYIPISASTNGNQICKSSPDAGIVYQRYTFGTSPSITNYIYACEATIYTWGYPLSESENYKNWFRNGELRWSDWWGSFSTVHPQPTDDAWWDGQCAQAWTQKANWIYTGTYKLTSTEYVDTGDPMPTPSPTPYHNACVNQTCQSVEGSGSNTCLADADCISSPTPTPSPAFSAQDLKNLFLNYLSSADGGYLPVDQKVNLLDGGFVIKNLE